MGLIQDLEATRDETLKRFTLGEKDLARTYAPGKWSIKFILHRLADSETVLYDRIRRVLIEPRQVLWVFDQDAWAKGLNYSEVRSNSPAASTSRSGMRSSTTRARITREMDIWSLCTA